MTAQLLSSELTNLIQESKRKNNDLKQAAEKSLEDLKSLQASNEAQIGAELSQKINFVNPFIIACGTKNAKYTGIAIVCLQRLIVAKALPRSKLGQVLEALQQATSAGLDVQLKILQALPSLLSNYSTDIKGDLLVTVLNICFTLQASKNAIVNNTSAATLQQLVVTVFDKVAVEDKAGEEGAVAGEAPTRGGSVQLRSAALDAYRLFSDLCLLTENQRPEYLRAAGLQTTFGLELIESVLTNHTNIFLSHPEQANVLQSKVMPLVISLLGGKPNFATSVRLVRILYTLLRRHLSILKEEGGEALELLTRILDQDSQLWKRSLCVELFRGIFSEPGLLRRIFVLYDARGKPVMKNLMATFVRVSTEKPAIIGLGHQSTIPTANPYGGSSASADSAMLEASGVSGIISGSSASEGHSTGISSQWSSIRVPCIDQLDKSEPPPIPESYIYSLTLSCITSLSEGLAKFILPLTIPGETRNRRKASKQSTAGRDSPAPSTDEGQAGNGPRGQLERSSSFKKNPVPVNPLRLEDHPLYAEVKTCAALIDECWPAILATCSTFLYAALDSEHYHGLVRAFQKFTHVAGLLELGTPRDAFLTTLGKAAVPPNIFTACLSSGSGRQTPTSSGAETPGGMFSNARGLLSVDSLVSQGSTSNDKQRQASFDATAAALNARNLLCLRALLNLGIALGPTLSSSWRIVLETLQQADFVLFASNKSPGKIPIATRGPDAEAEKEASALLSSFGTEIRAVETAASRLFESTVDFPNTSFVDVVQSVCALLEKTAEPPTPNESGPTPISPGGKGLRTPTGTHRRVMSISTSVSSAPAHEDQFALAKLGDLATINMERLLSYGPDESGWTPMFAELIDTASSSSAVAAVRQRAAETFIHVILEAAHAIASQPEEVRGDIQLRLLQALQSGMAPLQNDDRQLSVANFATDVEIHKAMLDGLKSLLEVSGETLIEGWDIVFDIIDSIFTRRQFSREKPSGDSRHSTVLLARSPKLIRPSFASLQLICSDFLSALPTTCFKHLVGTLYNFSSQDDDLNVALTTITFFWAISDFLSSPGKPLVITDAMAHGPEAGNDGAAADEKTSSSAAALWMLLLLRLTSVTADERVELRNSAVQTLLRIVSAYSDSLTSESWFVCLRTVIFQMLSALEEQERTSQLGADERNEWKDTAIVMIDGASALIANHLQTLTAHQEFKSAWSNLLGHYMAFLDAKILDVNAAVFSALAGILSRCSEQQQPGFDKGSVDKAWDLWSRSIPLPPPTDNSSKSDNQKCLAAWVSALLELYRLIQKDLTADRVQRMLLLLRQAMQQATAGAYASDVEYVTPLQGRILEVFKMVRTDVSGAPAAMIAQVADFVSLAFTQTPEIAGANDKRTYVAMSKESMPILQQLIQSNAADYEIYSSGALASALTALSGPITAKYSFPIRTKSIQPWRVATTAALAVLEETLPNLRHEHLEHAVYDKLWRIIVTVANGIISADLDRVPAGNIEMVLDDQDFDIASFRKLKELLIPALGGDDIPDACRKSFAEGLFRTSIIHAPAPAEASVIYGESGSTSRSDGLGLAELYKPRRGRTIDPRPSDRAKMAYACLDELCALVSSHDETSATPMINLQPPTPRFARFPAGNNASSSNDNGKGTNGAATHEPPHALHVRLARTAAPYLILRCALTLRAYIADQPLRGCMPQPLSQRKELAHILSLVVELRSESEAIPDMLNVESEQRKHLLRLYPLLVGVMGVAGRTGDEKMVGLVEGALEVVGDELGV